MVPRWRSSNFCKLGEMDRCIAFQIAYDGTDFAGSQLQPGVRTVQGELEQSWWRLHAEHVRVTLAGRTDAGVHASGQVGNVITTSERSLETILRAMNALLPPDVSIPQIWEPPRDFHARFWQSIGRTNTYLMMEQLLRRLCGVLRWLYRGRSMWKRCMRQARFWLGLMTMRRSHWVYRLDRQYGVVFRWNVSGG